MDILLYLLELIQTRKEIGLDGLGTLYKKKSPGRYDAETHLFLPPSYILDFTTAIRENQNLEQFISKKRNISIESANYFVSQFVAEAQKELKENGTFLLENLGELSLKDGELHFLPAKDINFGFDFYGLPPVNRTIEEPIPEEEISTEEEPIQSTATEELSLAAHIAEENKLEEENPGNESDPEEILITEEPIAEDIEQEPIVEEQPITEEIAAEERNSIPENHDWSFDEFASEPELVTLDQPVEEGIKQEKLLEETPFAIEKTVEIPPINEEDEVYEEISEVIPPTAVAPVLTNDEENSAVDFSKNWEFDEEEPKIEEKNKEIIPPFDEETGEEIVEEDKGMPQYLKIILGALVILVTIVIIYFINPNLFSSFVKNDINPDQKIAVPIAEQDNLKTQKDSLAAADEIVKNAQDLGLEIEKPRDTLKATVTAKPLSGTTYEVISVAFESQKEVDRYIEKMKTIGIVAKAVPAMPGKLMIKVSVATFNNLDSAYKELPKLKKTLKNQGLYIHTNKQK